MEAIVDTFYTAQEEDGCARRFAKNTRQMAMGIAASFREQSLSAGDMSRFQHVRSGEQHLLG
jgi:hypothetical protein